MNTSITYPNEQLNLLCSNVLYHLENIYKGIESAQPLMELAHDIINIMRLPEQYHAVTPHQNHWSESDVVLITYGNSVQKADEAPLETLHHFLDEHIDGCINSVHILPFFPYCSDDGFAIKDYYQVNPTFGDWTHVESIADDYRLMADLVINHGSTDSQWFKNFIAGAGEGHDYFFTTEPNIDASKVVRPRTSPLLRETETENGTEYVWCTFSHTQADFDFRNTEVLKEFVTIIRFYLDRGVRIFRLDAIAFLWKKFGSRCINLPETHGVVRLIRSLIEHAQPDSVLITETNIPNRENLSYFGNANEAHCIYNFSLPPLLVNTMITGNCVYLKQWMMTMPPAQNGTAYFNFIASHDGIGLRPAEGLLSEDEITTLINTMQQFGGHISWRTGDMGMQKPYEINISLFDALQGTVNGKDKYNIPRFICAHAIMLALEGIPGIYIHSFVATSNDLDKLERTQHNRSINRHEWDYTALTEKLADSESQHSMVSSTLKSLIDIRKKQIAFHPNATQFTLHMGDQIFAFWRQSINRKQSIFSISNISNTPQSIHIPDLNLILTDDWYDLISGQVFDENVQDFTLEPYQTLWVTNLK